MNEEWREHEKTCWPMILGGEWVGLILQLKREISRELKWERPQAIIMILVEVRGNWIADGQNRAVVLHEEVQIH